MKSKKHMQIKTLLESNIDFMEDSKEEILDFCKQCKSTVTEQLYEIILEIINDICSETHLE